MVTPGLCPEPRLLAEMLLGRLSPTEMEQLEAHLGGCPRCLALAERLTPADTFIEAVQSVCVSADVTQMSPPPASRGDEATLRQPSAMAETCPGEPNAPPLPGHDLLQPPQAPGELGRLGPYRVLRLLGAGGMGSVFLAEDPRLRRQVALKVINRDMARRSDARERFLREARATAALEHDHVVAIYQADEDQGVPFLAMPLLRGEALEDRLKRTNAPLPLNEALRITREIASGLAAAHAKGLIHRDIKPANVWLEESGRVKVLDFGLARALDSQDASISHPEAIVGTPAYMAPEQARAEAIDARTDLFSLGCVLYRLCTGRQPFAGRSAIDTLMAVINNEPPAPGQLNPQVPADVVSLIRRLMAKDPGQRPASAAAVVELIRAIEQKRAPQPRRSRWPLAIVALLLLALVPLAWFAAPTVHRFVTDQGEVVIETDDPDVEIKVTKNGEEVTIVDTRTRRSFLLKSGTYDVQIVGGEPGLSLSASSFTIKRGDRKIVSVTREPLGELVFQGPSLTGTVKARSGDRVAASAALKEQTSLRLPQGQYELSLSEMEPGQRLWPASVTLQAGRKQTVEVYVVGPLEELSGHEGRIWSLALAPDGKRLATGAGGEQLETGFVRDLDSTARLWDLAQGKQTRKIEGHAQPVRRVAFDLRGERLLTAGSDGRVQVVDLATGKTICAYLGHKQPVWAATFSPDGKWVLSGDSAGILMLWEAATGEAIEGWSARHEGPRGATIKGTAFTPDGERAVTAGQDGKAHVWDVAGRRRERSYEGHTDAIDALALTPDGRWALTGSADGTVQVWEVKTGKTVLTFKGHPEAVVAVAVTADGRRAFSASRSGLLFWETASGRVLQRFEWKGRPITAVTVSADGRRGYSAGLDRTIRVWGLPRD